MVGKTEAWVCETCPKLHCSSRVEAAQIPGPSPGVSRAAGSPKPALSPAGITEILMNRPSARNALGNIFVSEVRKGGHEGGLGLGWEVSDGVSSAAAGSSGPAAGGPASACPDLQKWSEGCILCRWVSFPAPTPWLSRAPPSLQGICGVWGP